MSGADPSQTAVFEQHESQLRTYCRRFPTVFTTASGHRVMDEDGRCYLDLMAGAGALNYGHNHPHIKGRVLEYLCSEGIVHSLDLYTAAKRDFIERFAEVILIPRGLDYRLAFTGPTGTNAVEAALKLARRKTGRSSVVAFTNGFHGLSLGSLAATANAYKRGAAGVPLQHVLRLPFEGFLGDDVDTARIAEHMLTKPGAGVDPPAAFIVETIQGEGGLHTSSAEWLRRISDLAVRIGALLIVDDIQAGCGRSGAFFSFEQLGVVPDIVCLSKSLSGLGLPMSLVLVKPEHDVLGPGEHSGTFRGHDLAFVGATAALDLWGEAGFVESVGRLADHLERRLGSLPSLTGRGEVELRGRGLLRGIAWADPAQAERVSAEAFERRLLIETAGASNEVLKLMPTITMNADDLDVALDSLDEAITAVAVGGRTASSEPASTRWRTASLDDPDAESEGTGKRTAKLVRAWPVRAAVRRQRYRFEEGDSFEPARPDYPLRLVPFGGHPEFLGMAEQQQQTVLSLAWLAYNSRVIAAEREIALPAMRSILNGRYAALDRTSLLRGVQQSIVDEEFHVYIHMGAIDSTERHRRLRLPESFPPSVIVRQYRRAVAEATEAWQRDLATIAWMIVSEVSINAYLELLSTDEEIQPNHSHVVRLHARDETVHSSIVLDVASLLFVALSDIQQRFFAEILPEVTRSFLAHDTREWETILSAAGCPDPRRILDDIIGDEFSLLTRDFSGVESLALDLGIIDRLDLEHLCPKT
jgi:diaminobutyrate-2-oxoglutarate transaminase